MLGDFSCVTSHWLTFFQNYFFKKKSFGNTIIRVSNGLDLDQDRHSVGLHLGPNYFQKPSARTKFATSRQRVKLTLKKLKYLSKLDILYLIFNDSLKVAPFLGCYQFACFFLLLLSSVDFFKIYCFKNVFLFLER